MVIAFPNSPSSLLHLWHLHIRTNLMLFLHAQPNQPQCYFAPHLKTLNVLFSLLSILLFDPYLSFLSTDYEQLLHVS